MKKTSNGDSRGYEEDVEGRNKEDRKKTWNGESRGYKEEVEYDCCYDCSLVCVGTGSGIYCEVAQKNSHIAMFVVSNGLEYELIQANSVLATILVSYVLDTEAI